MEPIIPPPGSGRPLIYDMNPLKEVGQYVSFPVKNANSVKVQAYTWAKKNGVKVATRVMGKEIRVYLASKLPE
jgi:hypothetical protein